MKLCAYRCKTCGKRTHPARFVCDSCGGREFVQEPLEGPVRLLTYTRVHNLPAGINKPHLDFGIVEFENGVRVSGQLELRSPAAVGMKMEASSGVVRVLQGEEITGFIFREP